MLLAWVSISSFFFFRPFAGYALDMLKGLDAATVGQHRFFAWEQKVPCVPSFHIEQIAEMSDPVHRFL